MTGSVRLQSTGRRECRLCGPARVKGAVCFANRSKPRALDPASAAAAVGRAFGSGKNGVFPKPGRALSEPVLESVRRGVGCTAPYAGALVRSSSKPPSPKLPGGFGRLYGVLPDGGVRIPVRNAQIAGFGRTHYQLILC